jgi:hypothetical protein
MRGPGSGRPPTRCRLDEYRALEIGELCDRGRWRSQPSGLVEWREQPADQHRRGQGKMRPPFCQLNLRSNNGYISRDMLL